ncbi:MAG: aryl-sulfate sulfotransferase [Myxococcales bacterium]|nr:aryl-sulfate sulfotransferase [Myxococcales bacterium]
MLPYLMRSGSTADRARPTCARARGLVAAGLIALAVTSVACGDSGSKETDSGTSDTDDGTLDQIALAYTPSESSVLSGTLAIATDAPTSVVSVVVEPLDGAPTWEVPASGIASAPDGRSHEVMILGLKEARAYTFTATVRHDEGEGQPERSAELMYTTEPLPEAFAPVQFHGSDPARMQPGVTFFDSTSREGFTATGGYLLAVDALGDVVWYYTAPTVQQPADLRRLQNGNLMFLGFDDNGVDPMAVEIDMLGREVARWTRESTGIVGIHGDLFELPDGAFVTMGLELREISGYPNDNTYKVVGEIVTEFALDNTIVREHKLLDILDPYRIASQDFHNAFYAQLFGPMTKDWAHVNGVIYDDSDDSFVVSSRHQDLVFKLDRQTGALVWLIGTPHASSAVDDSWPFLELVGDGALPNHMHAPQVLPEGHLMVFDNNNKGRASRAVEYAIDVDAMTIEQVWEYSDPDYDPAIFSIFIGDADTQANGNVLIDFGATLVDPTSLDTRGAYAHIIEVDRATGDKVFELDVRGAEGDEKQRLVYRADRQPSLYAL